MTVQVDLILPGLFQLPAHEIEPSFLHDRLSALNRLLRFARPLTNALTDFESILTDSLDLPDRQYLPFASAFVEPSSDASHLLCQACHLKPDMRNAFIVPLDDSEQTIADINIIFKDLAELFKDDCDLNGITEGVWLMQVKHCQLPSIYPHYLSAVGRKLDQYIEQTRAFLPWYQLINEMQMFMHGHAVNQKRLLEGKLTINSLWCWGAGEFVSSGDKQRWFCDDFLLNAYAQKAEVECLPLSAIKRADFLEPVMAVDLSLLQALKSSEPVDLANLLNRLETDLFAPLTKAAEQGRIRLRLRAGHNFDWQLSRFSRYKFWRKNSSLSDWIQ